MSQAVTCRECALFVEAVQGLRGPYWHGRARAGLRRSYRAGLLPARDGAVNVSGQFFHLLRDRTCAEWLDHLSMDVVAEDDDVREHVRQLPAWVRALVKDLPQRTGPHAAAQLAAAVLGVSVRSVYPRS